MSCVRAVCVVTSQIVHVVSIDEVPIKFGSDSFQSKLVSGAQYSEVLFYGVICEACETRVL